MYDVCIGSSISISIIRLAGGTPKYMAPEVKQALLLLLLLLLVIIMIIIIIVMIITILIMVMIMIILIYMNDNYSKHDSNDNNALLSGPRKVSYIIVF